MPGYVHRIYDLKSDLRTAVSLADVVGVQARSVGPDYFAVTLLFAQGGVHTLHMGKDAKHELAKAWIAVQDAADAGRRQPQEA